MLVPCALALATDPATSGPQATVIHLNASTPGESANGTTLSDGISGQSSVLSLFSAGSLKWMVHQCQEGGLN